MKPVGFESVGHMALMCSSLQSGAVCIAETTPALNPKDISTALKLIIFRSHWWFTDALFSSMAKANDIF